jgi:hypothetical protein
MHRNIADALAVRHRQESKKIPTPQTLAFFQPIFLKTTLSKYVHKETSMTTSFSKAFKALMLSAFVATSAAQALPANANIRSPLATSGVRPAMALSWLQGSWAATLTGDTACGISTMYVTFTLNASGQGLATIHGHSAGCGDNVSAPNLSFDIQSLNADGSGTAALSCGTNCGGWNLFIQVSPDLQEFNMVDVINRNNFVEGTAIRRSTF